MLFHNNPQVDQMRWIQTCMCRLYSTSCPLGMNVQPDLKVPHMVERHTFIFCVMHKMHKNDAQDMKTLLFSPMGQPKKKKISVIARLPKREMETGWFQGTILQRYKQKKY